MNVNEDMATDIVKFRAKHGLSQTEFAKKCGVSLPTINALECRRRSTVSRKNYFKIREVIYE